METIEEKFKNWVANIETMDVQCMQDIRRKLKI